MIGQHSLHTTSIYTDSAMHNQDRAMQCTHTHTALFAQTRQANSENTPSTLHHRRTEQQRRHDGLGDRCPCTQGPQDNGRIEGRRQDTGSEPQRIAFPYTTAATFLHADKGCLHATACAFTASALWVNGNSLGRDHYCGIYHR